MTTIKGFENINELRNMIHKAEEFADYKWLGFNNEGLPIIDVGKGWTGWVLPDFYIRAEIDGVRIKAVFSVNDGGTEKYINSEGRVFSGPTRGTLYKSIKKLCGWTHRNINISCENGDLSAAQIKDLCDYLRNMVPYFTSTTFISDRTKEQNGHFGVSINDDDGATYWNCYNLETEPAIQMFKDGEPATNLNWVCDKWLLIISDFYADENRPLTDEEKKLREIHEEIKKMNLPLPVEQLLAAEKSEYELDRLKRVAVVNNFLEENKDMVLYNGKKVSEWCKIDDYYGTTGFFVRGYPNYSEEEKNWNCGEDWGFYNFCECDAEEALNMTKSAIKMLSYDEQATVIFDEILSLIDELNIKNHITRCDRDRYEIDLTSEYDDCKINLCWTDDDNVNIAYTSMFTSVNGQWGNGKQWSNTQSIKDVKNRIIEWTINLQNPLSEAQFRLMEAIRERDEKIAAEEARKRAEEEKELARQKAEEERVRLENKKNFQEFELITKFVDEIGDFEVKVPSEEGDGTFTYMPIRQVISFDIRHRPRQAASYLINFGYHMNFDCDDSTSFSVNEHGYEKAKKIIIDWAVHYGAREPELTQVGQ